MPSWTVVNMRQLYCYCILLCALVVAEPADMHGTDSEYVVHDDGLKFKINYKPEDCQYETNAGDTIVWNYHGTLLDGTEFDKGEFKATLGAGHVIPGVDRAMRDMCVGEKRHMIIPHQLAYGERGYPGAIPPSATIQFQVELKKITQAHSDL